MAAAHIVRACLLVCLFTFENYSALPPPKKVAILGGGVSSCITALALSEQPDWQEKYEITIYQVDWKLGGKGASGRNAEYGQRIEEHGPHIWFGFYQNAFSLMRRVYEELDRPEGSLLRTIEDAFTPIDDSLFLDPSMPDSPWTFHFPTLPGFPGDGVVDCSLSQIITQLGHILADNVNTLTETFGSTGSKRFMNPGNLKEVFSKAEREIVHQSIIEIQNWLQSTVFAISSHVNGLQASTRRLMIMTDLATAAMKGILDDGVLENGFDVINDIELTAWLRKHGASQMTADSILLSAIYEAIVNYKDSDRNKPDLEAGTGLKYIFNAYICYRGHVMYLMTTGMGDAIFAPIYQVLKNRGVNIKFFHRVDNLKLNPSDPTLVEEIEITQLVKTKNNEYNPLINVKGVPSWPNKPKFDQIDSEQSTLLQQNDVKLDRFWSTWPQVYKRHFNEALPKVILKRGEDFDIVVYGMPVKTLGFYASELLEVSPALKATYENVGAVATQFVTLWFDKSAEELGWPQYYGTLPAPLNAGPYPFKAYVRMDHIIWSEEWESLGMKAKHVTFITSTQNTTEIPPADQIDFLEKCEDEVKENFVSGMTKLKEIIPHAFSNGEFDWSVLLDPQNRTAEERFNSQFFRSNVDPSERYTCCHTNTSKYRITTDGAGFQNVYFTGDWIKNFFEVGTVEGSTQSALLTSRAISGSPKVIFYEDSW